MFRISLAVCALLSLVCLASAQTSVDTRSFGGAIGGHLCVGPPVKGPCEALFEKWYYDRQARDCKKFIYGGCDGNDLNRFDSKEECEKQCTGEPSTVNVCRLPKKIGPCDAAIPRWYYNYQTRKCEQFSFGGCEANGNNFHTEKQCKNKCDPNSDQPPPVDKCGLPADSGPCKALIWRWFFNKKTGKCEQFAYGGCKGNGNNFKTRLECQRACRKDCDFVSCVQDPCSVIECPRFPHAKCVPNFCTGCDADFFVRGRLVKCGVRPSPSYSPFPDTCIQPEGTCKNPKAQGDTPATGNAFFFPCCGDLKCCACGPPVETEGTKPPPFGKCRAVCICPRG